jgi:hypothetical protein
MRHRRDWLVLLALGACGTHDTTTTKQDPAAPVKPAAPPPRTLDTLQMQVPDGWQATYDKASDAWLFATPSATARIERADPHVVASPDAYLHARREHWPTGTTADFEKRESVKGGFAMTVSVKPAADPAHPRRETYVVRELGSVYYECISEAVPDDATRDQLVALCKSLKL